MNKRFVDLLKSKFLDGLKVKTSWGRNEVIDLFMRALAEAAVEVLD